MKTNNSTKYVALALLLIPSLEACEVYYTPYAPVFSTIGASVTFSPGANHTGIRLTGMSTDNYFQDWTVAPTTFSWTIRNGTLYLDKLTKPPLRAYSLPLLGVGSHYQITLTGATTTSFYTVDVAGKVKYIPFVGHDQTLIFANKTAQGVLSLNPGGDSSVVTFTVVK